MKYPTSLLVVKDLTTSKNFYVDLLGASILEEYPDCLRLKIDTHDILMFQGTQSSNIYEHGGNASSTLIFPVANLEEKAKELKAKGVPFLHESPGQNQWGRYMAFKDPSGIVHELMELGF